MKYFFIKFAKGGDFLWLLKSKKESGRPRAVYYDALQKEFNKAVFWFGRAKQDLEKEKSQKRKEEPALCEGKELFVKKKNLESWAY